VAGRSKRAQFANFRRPGSTLGDDHRGGVTGTVEGRGPGGRRATRPRGSIKPAAVRLIERHGDALFATAKRYTLSREDAEDAYQRGLEILLTKAPALPEQELLPWMRTVVKHEAFAIWRSQDRTVTPPAEEWERAPAPTPAPDEQVESYERLRVGAEAIRRLKPQEVRCLALRAEGHSYRQICEITGWTYTKVNRCLTEGRRSFLERVAGIESGAECERLGPLLSAFADGEATAAEMTKLRPHLRSCLACRAALRAFRELPHRAAEVVPLPVAAEAGPRFADAADAVWRWGESAAVWTQERVGLIAAKAQAAVEASSATKAAAVAASAAALASGTAAVSSLDGAPGDPGPSSAADAGTRLLERAAPTNLVPRIPPAPSEPELAATLAPPAPAPPPAPDPPVAPPPAPPPPAAAPVVESSGRSERFPKRVTTPVEDPGNSALADVDEEERTIGPTTKPAEPVAAPGGRQTADGP